MKTITNILLISMLLLLIAGCTQIDSKPTLPPTKVEQGVFEGSRGGIMHDAGNLLKGIAAAVQ